jgi:hypothetical protein
MKTGYTEVQKFSVNFVMAEVEGPCRHVPRSLCCGEGGYDAERRRKLDPGGRGRGWATDLSGWGWAMAKDLAAGVVVRRRRAREMLLF